MSKRLELLLNMLASEFDGERANAAKMIATMAKKEGKTVSQFVMSPQVIYRDRIVEKPVYRDPPPPDDDLRRYRPKNPRRSRQTEGDIIQGLRWAQDFPEHLSGFEANFISDILFKGFDEDDLSFKQRRVAEKIIRKVKAYQEDEPLI